MRLAGGAAGAGGRARRRGALRTQGWLSAGRGLRVPLRAALRGHGGAATRASPHDTLFCRAEACRKTLELFHR